MLEVATESAHQPGLTKYLISVKLPEGDRVSSVYGTDVHPLTVRAPKGVFNSPYNGSWSGSGMNPKFFEIMPDMADDTYATIGLSTAANGAGQNGRVFLMQVTTEGDLSGAINLQLFPASGDYDQLRYRFEFEGKGEYPGIAIE